MRPLLGLLALLLSLAFQAALGRWVPGLHRYLDVLLLPVLWYALSLSQRSAMLVGFAAGTLQDAWFQTGVFGISGFSKTLLGWALGGLGARFEMNRVWGWFSAGILTTLADRLLQAGLLRLLDQQPGRLQAAELGLRSAATGLLATLVFAMLNRARRRDAVRRPRRRS